MPLSLLFLTRLASKEFFRLTQTRTHKACTDVTSAKGAARRFPALTCKQRPILILDADDLRVFNESVLRTASLFRGQRRRIPSSDKTIAHLPFVMVLASSQLLMQRYPSMQNALPGAVMCNVLGGEGWYQGEAVFIKQFC